MGKSIRSNSKKAFRSQRRGLIGEEPAVQKAEAARIAALAKCLAAPPKEGLSAVDPGPGPSKLAHQDAMELDGGEAGTASRSRSRGRSRQRGQPEAAEGSDAPVASPAALDGDVDMDADPAQVAKSVRGPNQYKKQGRLKVGAKARLGVSGKAPKLGSKTVKKARVHGLQSGTRKPRFSNSSKRK